MIIPSIALSSVTFTISIWGYRNYMNSVCRELS